MNLIEQLGGYEAAKKKYSERPHAFVWGDIGKALLSYRRVHGIFDVGDFVCFKTLGDGYVHKYTKYHEFKYDLKHATDEEIKAGKRLEILNESE